MNTDLDKELKTASAPESGPWKFDETVTNVFESMLALSIPGYNDMRAVIERLGSHLLRKHEHPRILDVGASTGEGSSVFIQRFPDSEFHLIDISEPMLDKMRERFKGFEKRVKISNINLKQRPDELTAALTNRGALSNFDLVLATLTLIFVPMAHRKNVLRGIYNSMAKDGMFLITEKLHGNTWYSDNMLVDNYHELKHDNGYSYEAIERKRLSLETVQVCKSQSENEADLISAGFRHVECVHRYLNFATFMAIK